MGIFSKLKEGLQKTRQGFTEKIDSLFSGSKAIDEGMYEELEEILLQADVGINTTMMLINGLRQSSKEQKIADPEQLKHLLQEKVAGILKQVDVSLKFADQPPTVVLVVGVNGVGKTTTIGKLAYKYKQEGYKVLLAAGDTFRAAAIDQLEIWGNRVGVEIVKHQEGADPAAVVYDALQAAKARKIDLLIVDTAGRLHTKVNLMEEVKKVKRVIEREIPGAPHEVLMVLDATTGQNALSQAKIFSEAMDLTGIVLTKLDGTAKGGIVIALNHELQLPIKFIGLGEHLKDLREFNTQEFVEALFAK